MVIIGGLLLVGIHVTSTLRIRACQEATGRNTALL